MKRQTFTYAQCFPLSSIFQHHKTSRRRRNVGSRSAVLVRKCTKTKVAITMCGEGKNRKSLTGCDFQHGQIQPTPGTRRNTMKKQCSILWPLPGPPTYCANAAEKSPITAPSAESFTTTAGTLYSTLMLFQANLMSSFRWSSSSLCINSIRSAPSLRRPTLRPSGYLPSPPKPWWTSWLTCSKTSTWRGAKSHDLSILHTITAVQSSLQPFERKTVTARPTHQRIRHDVRVVGVGVL